MNLPRLPYLFEPRVKGKRYTYYRRGGARTSLPPRDTPDFLLAYHAAHTAAEAAAKPPPESPTAAPGSLAALVAAYRASAEWRGLAPASRVDYDKALRPLEDRFGRLPVATMPRQFVFKLRAEFASAPAARRNGEPILGPDGVQLTVETPRRANRMVNVLRLLLAWALNRGGWVRENVALRPGRLKTGDGFRMWTTADVAAFMESAPEPIRRAAVLGLCTGQRKGDCLAMTWADRADGRIEVVQAKTGARLRIPEHADLTAALDAAPRPYAWPRPELDEAPDTILTRVDGRPWKEDHFNHAFADAVRDAGLSGLSFHGLRKTASGWLAECGATDAEIDSVLGHVDPKMTRFYRQQADQLVRAEAAMGKLAGRRMGATK